jgi:hypothetical protein
VTLPLKGLDDPVPGKSLEKKKKKKKKQSRKLSCRFAVEVVV